MAIFGTDKTLLYDIDPWNKLGFGVPNFGDNDSTKNRALHGLADEIGKAQLLIMTHEDAGRTQPPTVNTCMRLGKILNRITSVLESRSLKDSDMRIEGVHVTSNPIPWQIHPVPYFKAEMTRNHWLMEYNDVTMVILCNFYQHSENNDQLNISNAFAEAILKYVGLIKKLLGVELLGLAKDVVEAKGFKFVDAHFSEGQFNPSSFTINYERLDSPTAAVESSLTEDDLKELFKGIPANIIQHSLSQYPVTKDGEGFGGRELTESQEATGVSDGSAVAKPGGTLGDSTI